MNLIKKGHALIIPLLILTQSCKVIRPNTILSTPDNYNYTEFKSPEHEYRIKPYDKLRISITTNDGYKLISIDSRANQQNIKGEIDFLVEFDGQVKLPTLGRVNVAGQTVREAEKQLEQLYSAHYQNPFVLMQVVNRKVYLFKGGGEVGIVLNIPEENLNLLEAIAMSGGLLDTDKAYRIKLIRGNPSDTPQVFLYNIRDLSDLKGANLQLESDDIIHIESRPRYVYRVLNEITPYLALFSTILLVINISRTW